MIRSLALLIAVSLAAACSKAPATGQAEAATAPAPTVGCSAQAARDWSAVGSQYYLLEADARGRTCADAEAILRIKSSEGVLLFEHTYTVANVPLAFNPANDRSGLRADLEMWLQNTSGTQTADELPPWPAGAASPPGFQPIVNRGQYEHARGMQGPLFCFPNGAESNACVAMAGDHATLLGSLTAEIAPPPAETE